MSGERRKAIQNMVNLLRQGATLTELSCPVCSSPLFRLKNNELWCARCQKRVVVVREGESPLRATEPILLDSLETTILSKIRDLGLQMQEETDVDRLERLGNLLSNLLSNLEKIRRIREGGG